MAEDLPTPGVLDKVLVNPKRFMIATILYLRGPTTMAELQRMLGLSWGDLDSQLRALKANGYISTRKIITRSGPRTLAELTPKGRASYENLLDTLDKIIDVAKRSPDKSRDN